MPVLGADMDQGTLIEWLVKPGDEIRKGDVIAVVDTAKSAIEVESFYTGTVERLIIPTGQTVPVGTALATIAEHPEGKRPARKPVTRQGVPRPAPAAEQAQPRRASSPPVRHLARQLGVDLAAIQGTGRAGAITRADVQRAASAAGPPAAQALQQPAGQQPAKRATAGREPAARQRAAPPLAPRQPVTPRARRVAAELGVDLAGVTGTGPGGAVREADVRQAAPPRQDGATLQRAGPEPVMPSARAADRAQAMRHAIARLMARSKREIPHYYLSNTVDMSSAMDWLHERNRELEVSERLVPAALMLKAVAVAARRVPQLNGFWIDDDFTPADDVHVGVATSLRGGGLVTPAIHGSADLSLEELMARLRDLITRARAGRLRGSELTDATITVTNLGDQGVESVFGVIYPPQVALVGFGKVIERPVAVGDLIGVRPVVVTTLAADHRATDGYTGGRYLTAISDLLQRPEEM